jgi:hypothetical protein
MMDFEKEARDLRAADDVIEIGSDGVAHDQLAKWLRRFAAKLADSWSDEAIPSEVSSWLSGKAEELRNGTL